MLKVNRSIGICAAALSLAALAGTAQAAEIKLPPTVVWTAYDVGSSGYSQAVGVGSALKNALGINLRVLPGKNDVSRLAPVRDGKATFTATGSDSVYAQEAIYVFGRPDWGPQPVRLLTMNVADGSAVALTTARDANIRTLADLKGKRVAWVKGAPALNKAVESMLRFANLTWDDVVIVEVGGYGQSVNALIEGQLDALNGATFSAPFLKVEASPRGIYFPPVPHDDEEGWKRLREVVPWYFKHICTDGPTIPESGQEMANTPYPILIGMAREDADFVYNMTKAMYVFYPEYKDSAPGANGWALERQRFAEVVLPYHDGAIRYYKEIGAWKPEYQKIHEDNLERQKLIQTAWQTYAAKADESDEAAFEKGWMKARYDALTAAGLNPILETWEQ